MHTLLHLHKAPCRVLMLPPGSQVEELDGAKVTCKEHTVKKTFKFNIQALNPKLPQLHNLEKTITTQLHCVSPTWRCLTRHPLHLPCLAQDILHCNMMDK